MADQVVRDIATLTRRADGRLFLDAENLLDFLFSAGYDEAAQCIASAIEKGD